MPSKDTRLRELEARLRGLESRKSQLQRLQDDEFSRQALRLVEQNIAAVEREIRKRQYVLSPKSGSKGV
jgi:hypothetical protein